MLGGVDYILEAVALSTLSSPTSDIQGDASERQRNRRAARAAPGCTGAKRPRERIQRSRMPTASPTSTANKLPSEQALQRVLICTGCTYVHNKSLALSGLSGSRSKFVGLRLVAIGFAWALCFFMICMGSLLFFCGLTFFAARGELCVCLSKVSRRPGLSSGLEDGVCSNCRRSPAPHFRGCPRRHSRSRSPHRRGSRT